MRPFRPAAGLALLLAAFAQQAPQPYRLSVTCFPFYFMGAAPKRFLVRAERIT